MTRGSSFAGFNYQKKLSTGFYGQMFRASAPDGAVVDVLHVDTRISGIAGFADALTASGSALSRIDEPVLIGTRTVGSTIDGTLVVVTESEPAGLTVEDLLRCSPSGLPHAIAALIGYEVVSGLTSLHRGGTIHGALHPRSVLVQIDGTVRVRDLAVGRALVLAGSRVRSPLLRTGFGGYLAPEVALGRAPAPTADVYGAAALIYAMLSGSMPPGTLGLGAGFERMIQRALDGDSSRRYASAAELLANVAEAFEDEGWARATEEELAGYVMDQQPKVLALHKAARGQGQGLGGVPGALQGAARSGPVSMPAMGSAAVPRSPADSNGEVDQATEELISLLDGPGSGPAGLPGLNLDDLGPSPLDDASLSELEQPTRVDSDPKTEERDPVSQLIELAGLGAPLDPMRPPPELAASEPVSPRFSSTLPLPAEPVPVSVGRPASKPAHQPDRQVEIAALQVIESLAEERSLSQGGPPATMADTRPASSLPLPASVPRPASVPLPAAPVPRPVSQPVPVAAVEPQVPAASAQPIMPDLDVIPEMLEPPKSGRIFGRALWLLVIVGAIGALVWVVDNQRKLREESERRKQEQQAANEAALAAFQASQPKDGRIAVNSEPDQAAVWLLLGRTPVDSMQLSTAMLHELRVEFEGYQPHDLRVEGSTWTGDGEVRTANVKAKLEPRNPKKPVPPYPPEPPASAREGLREGKGYIHVESEPPGAQVWLLVGFTPGVEISGSAGTRYELKVQKDGYLPGFVVIEPGDWNSGGDGNRVSRNVTLVRDSSRRK